MAKIVLIGPTLVSDKAYLKDVVSIHDENVNLGPAYALFVIAHVPEYTAQQVLNVFDGIKEEVNDAYKTSAEANTWSFVEPERVKVWDDDGTWRFVEEKPKYRMNLPTTLQELADLEDPEVSGATKLTILQKAIDNIHRDSVNQTPVPGQ